MIEIKKYLTNNECYIRKGKLLEARGVLIHSTATPGANPENFANIWNTYRPNGNQVCVHAFCDDAKVINTLPYDMRCWGCGGSGNNYYIQIEMCEPKGIYFCNGWEYKIKEGYEQTVKDYITRAVDIVAEWAANRLLELGIHEVNEYTVTSHYEAHGLGMASNHGDPEGLLKLANMTMNDIRNKIRKIVEYKDKSDINNNKSDINKDKSDVNKKLAVGDIVRFTSDAVQFNGNTIPKSYINKLYKIKSINNKNNRTVLTINDVVMYAVDIKYLVKYVEDKSDVNKDKSDINKNKSDYKIRVTCDNLNVRKEPGTSYPIVTSIKDRGIYTIVEVDKSGKWGKLKSGIGWIHLGYTSKI